MKSKLNLMLAWLVLSLLMLVFWILGMMVGNVFFPSSLIDEAEGSGGLGEMLVVCALNTMAVLILVYHSRLKGLKLAGIIALTVFGVQFFMSQIETLWFNDAVKFPLEGLRAIVFGGFMMAVLFSGATVLMTRNLRSIKAPTEPPTLQIHPAMAMRIGFLVVIAYPALYFLAGYFIAWQFADVRAYYTSVTELQEFFPIMKANIVSGLYFFQIFRGLLWIGIAIPAIFVLNGRPFHKGVIVGLLFAFLGSTQLLIPNPFMPDGVRFAHLLETITSNFIWGFLVGWVVDTVGHMKPLDRINEFSKA